MQIENRLNKLTDYLINFVTRLFREPKFKIYYLIIPSIVVFIISIFLILRNNGFFSGDMGVNALMVEDMKNGKFFSLYFYGQNYFGNLAPIVLSFLTIFTGVTKNTMYFWEHFFYLVSIIFFLASIKKLTIIESFIYPIIFFFSIRFYYFIYVPQGFAFVLAIIAIFHYYFNEFHSQTLKNTLYLSFFTGLFTTLSLWHNPTYIFIGFAYFLVYFINWYFNKIKLLKQKDFYLFFAGLVIGFIPMILGLVEKNYKNLEIFFGDNSTPLVERLLGSFKIYFLDYFFYYQKIDSPRFRDIVAGQDSFKMLFLEVLKPENINGAVLAVFLFLVVLLGFIFLKKTLVTYIFLACVGALMVYRGTPSNVEYDLFASIRYAIPFYSLLLVIVFKTINSLFLKSENDLENTQNPVVKILKKFSLVDFVPKYLSVYLLLSLLLISAVNATKLYIDNYTGQQFYESILDRIKAENVKVAYCDDYYQACGTLAFLGNKENIDFQLINTTESSQYRNPDDINKADIAYEKGERVLSIIKAERLSEEDQVIGTYGGGTRYYIIEGRFAKYQDSK